MAAVLRTAAIVASERWSPAATHNQITRLGSIPAS